MDIGIATLVASVITGVCGLLGLAVKEFRELRRRNEADHGVVMLKLNKVQKSVDRVVERLDDHIDWHLKK